MHGDLCSKGAALFLETARALAHIFVSPVLALSPLAAAFSSC